MLYCKIISNHLFGYIFYIWIHFLKVSFSSKCTKISLRLSYMLLGIRFSSFHILVFFLVIVTLLISTLMSRKLRAHYVQFQYFKYIAFHILYIRESILGIEKISILLNKMQLFSSILLSSLFMYIYIYLFI